MEVKEKAITGYAVIDDEYVYFDEKGWYFVSLRYLWTEYRA